MGDDSSHMLNPVAKNHCSLFNGNCLQIFLDIFWKLIWFFTPEANDFGLETPG
jgi:hypothetical protein